MLSWSITTIAYCQTVMIGIFFVFGTHWSKNNYIISTFNAYFEMEAFCGKHLLNKSAVSAEKELYCFVSYVYFFAVKCVI